MLLFHANGNNQANTFRQTAVLGWPMYINGNPWHAAAAPDFTVVSNYLLYEAASSQ